MSSESVDALKHSGPSYEKKRRNFSIVKLIHYISFQNILLVFFKKKAIKVSCQYSLGRVLLKQCRVNTLCFKHKVGPVFKSQNNSPTSNLIMTEIQVNYWVFRRCTFCRFQLAVSGKIPDTLKIHHGEEKRRVVKNGEKKWHVLSFHFDH